MASEVDRQRLVAMTVGYALESCRWGVAWRLTCVGSLGQLVVIVRVLVTLLLRAIIPLGSLMSLLRVRDLHLLFRGVAWAVCLL